MAAGFSWRKSCGYCPLSLDGIGKPAPALAFPAASESACAFGSRRARSGVLGISGAGGARSRQTSLPSGGFPRHSFRQGSHSFSSMGDSQGKVAGPALEFRAHASVPAPGQVALARASGGKFVEYLSRQRTEDMAPIERRPRLARDHAAPESGSSPAARPASRLFRAGDSDSQLHDGCARAAFILRRLGHGFDVRVLLQILAQRLSQNAHTAAVHDPHLGQSG